MIAVWLRVRKGKGRKTNYALNWHVPVLDDNGDAVKYEGGRVKTKILAESCHTHDSNTAEAMRVKKRDQLNGLASATKPTHGSLSAC